jgi:hypothetical protein
MAEMFDDDGRTLTVLGVTGVLLSSALFTKKGGQNIADHWYVNVITQGPFVIVRTPWPQISVKARNPALVELMKTHGLKEKDISATEGLTMSPKDRADSAKVGRHGFYEKAYDDLMPKLDAAFAGGPGFEAFWLYAWEGDRKAGRFALVRKPLEKGS